MGEGGQENEESDIKWSVGSGVIDRRNIGDWRVIKMICQEGGDTSWKVCGGRI